MSALESMVLSPNIQMYLVTILRLRQGDEPVPISELAQELGVSPVSANEMARKLQDQGLLVYQPYRGVALTREGEQRARYVLRRHRLWEVFLVDRLGMEIAPAHQAACELEHSTPDAVSDRLDHYLGEPSVNPEGLPIPGAGEDRWPPPSVAALAAGHSGVVIAVNGDEAESVFLAERGIRPGSRVAVLASAPDSILLQAGDQSIALARILAEAVLVKPDEGSRSRSDTAR